jgi:hypothetical protein
LRKIQITWLFRMTDLPASTWREIELAALSFPMRTERFISLGALRTIIKKSRRTNDQNALLWALYDDALKQGGEALGGWTREDIHEYMLGEYHGWDKCTAFGRTRLKPKKRSSRLTKMEFSDFVEFVVRKFAEHGLVLELPGEEHGSSAS